MPLELGERHAGGGKISTFPIVFTNDSKYASGIENCDADRSADLVELPAGQKAHPSAPKCLTFIESNTNNPILAFSNPRYFFCACGNLVKMFSVTTGEQTRVLAAHEANVVGIAINPHNPLQLYSFSRDRRIYLWDFNDAIILRRFKVPFPVEHMAFAPNRSNVVYLAAYGSRIKNGATLPSYDIYEFNLDSSNDSDEGDSLNGIKAGLNGSQALDGACKLLLQTKARNRSSFLVSPDGQYLIVQSKRHWKVFHIASGKIKKFNHRNNISCIAIHPKQHFVATGDDAGEIIFWYIFGNSETTEDSKAKLSKPSSKRRSQPIPSQAAKMVDETADRPSNIRDDPVTTTHHWHAHRVGAITFDSTGSHMYSGGQEMVLVIWQLESGKKDWLPRLNAPILGMCHTPDETLLAIRCSDNTIKLINSRSRLLQVCVEGINLATPYLDLSMLSANRETAIGVLRQHRRAQRLKTGLIVEPRTNAFVFNATEGQLQFYNAHEDKNVMKIQVGPKNPVKTFQESQVAETEVMHVAFSGSGEWMVTVDGREDQLEQASLKFWYWDKTTQQYDLNTQYNINKSEKIRAIAYHPRKDILVSVSAGGQFKHYSVVQNRVELSEASAKVHGAKHHNKQPHPARFEVLEGSAKYRWIVSSAGGYHDLEPRAACFSSDGSLLAISYQHIITLWSPETNMLLTTLTFPPDHEPITKMAFLSESQFLVACSKRRLFVWDLLSCQLKWCQVIRTDILTTDSKSSRFAIYSPVGLTDWNSVIREAKSERSTQRMHEAQAEAHRMNIDDLESGLETDNESVAPSETSRPSSRIDASKMLMEEATIVHGINSGTSSSDGKKKKKQAQQAPKKVRTDGYIVLFSPESPAPQGFWVMPPLGVRGISFLTSRNSSRSSHHASAAVSTSSSATASAKIQSSLMYLNGQHELKFLLQADGNEEDQSLGSESAAAAMAILSSPSKSKKNQQNTLQLQQQFIAKINATKLADGPSVFTLMYGGSEPTPAPAAAPRAPNAISLPKIATASKKAPLPKGASANLSPQARLANQQTSALLHGIFQADVQVVPAPATLFPQFADALIFKTTAKENATASTATPGESEAVPLSSATSSLSTVRSASKPDDFKYVAPKKIAAAKMAHAEVAVEAKLLEAELAAIGVSGPSTGSDLSFLDDFFATIPSLTESASSASTIATPVVPTRTSTPKSAAKSPASRQSTISTPEPKGKAAAVSSMDVEDKAPSSSKKRKRSRSSLAAEAD
jgi:NET1-associated nuclear protein 1 (U3 small nucleolar RNA-associated protein 17)